jgi:hypothetical protein
MEYKEIHSSYDEGLKVLGIAIIIGALFYGGLHYEISKPEYDDIYSLKNGYQFTYTFLYIFHAVIFIGTTYGVFVTLSVSFSQMFSGKDWVVRIDRTEILHQSPHDNIGNSFQTLLCDIDEIHKIESSDVDNNISFEWYLIIKGEKVNISDNSPFDLERICEALCQKNPDIKLVETVIK